MLKRVVSMVVSAVSISLLSACVVAPAQRVAYAPVPAPRPVYAEFGRVENIGVIQIAQRQTGAGAVLGAVIGGIVGNSVGRGMGRAVATGAGVVGGAVAGDVIEGRTRHDDEVFRVQVRFDNGSVRDFDFQRIDDLRVGDRVKFENGQVQRI
jgi:outer membrane lipoprotein SlyB